MTFWRSCSLLVMTFRRSRCLSGAVADLNPPAAFPFRGHHRWRCANEEPYPARRPVIIGTQCSWNDHPWVLRVCRMSERYRRLLRQRCCCRASMVSPSITEACPISLSANAAPLMASKTALRKARTSDTIPLSRLRAARVFDPSCPNLNPAVS